MSTATFTKTSVKDVMTANPVFISPAASLRELAELLDANDISGVPVVNVNERVIGVVSKTDLLQQFIQGPKEAGDGSFVELLDDGLRTAEYNMDDEGCVEDFMSIDPVIANVEDSVGDVAQRMLSENVHRVVVLDADERLAGIVTTFDILRHVFA